VFEKILGFPNKTFVAKFFQKGVLHYWWPFILFTKRGAWEESVAPGEKGGGTWERGQRAGWAPNGLQKKRGGEKRGGKKTLHVKREAL